MWALADINGWKKYIEVPIDTEYRGFCYAVLERPIDMLISPNDIITDDLGVMKVMLRSSGYNKQGTPIYKYDP